MGDFFEEYGMVLAVSVVAAAVGISQIPNMQAKAAKDGQLTAIAATRQAETDKLNAEALKRKDRADTADKRYQGNCQVVSTLKDAKVAATIREGEPIVRGENAEAVASGLKKGQSIAQLAPYYWNVEQTFCDCYGVTAVTRPNSSGLFVASDIATTTNKAVINGACFQDPNRVRPTVKITR